jgi:glutaredoxin 3
MDITIVGKKTCPWCQAMYNFLDKSKIKYKKINYKKSSSIVKLAEKRNHFTIPQIWINSNFIGGYNETIKFLSKAKLKKSKTPVLKAILKKSKTPPVLKTKLKKNKTQESKAMLKKFKSPASRRM